MKVKASDDWTAEIHYRDGTKLMFESPGDMLAFYTAPDQYDVDEAHKDLSSVERLAVKDYQSKQPIDARQTTFVYKSKIEGPMGAEFIPFGSRETAETFITANGGRLLSLSEVTSEMVREVRK